MTPAQTTVLTALQNAIAEEQGWGKVGEPKADKPGPALASLQESLAYFAKKFEAHNERLNKEAPAAYRGAATALLLDDPIDLLAIPLVEVITYALDYANLGHSKEGNVGRPDQVDAARRLFQGTVLENHLLSK